MKNRILLSSPHMSDEGYEKNFVNLAFDTNWIAPLGQNVDNFENDIIKYTGSEHALALNSGTAAIHLALELAKVGKDDLVICQSLTFAASCNPIFYQGAKPIFVGSEKESWNMCPESLRVALEENPTVKAVIVVHLYGIPAKIEEISSICKEFNVILIEDAAESLGTVYKGKMTGTFGDFGIYSFNGNKIITTSGGGMLVSQNKDEIAFARKLSTQARENEIHYEHKYIGYNYRLSNVSAGIGRGQMMVLPERVLKKQEIYFNYKEAFASIKEIKMMPYVDESTSNCWLSVITLQDVNPNDLISYLNTHNIEARPIWKPMHLQPVFKEYKYYGDQFAQLLFETGVCLPSDTKMTSEEQSYVSNLIVEFMGQ